MSSPPRGADAAQQQPSLADLEALYDAHHRQAFGLAYRILGSRADAEEVVQEAFLAAWRAGHTYDQSKGSTQAWLLTLARNRAIDALRARRRRPVEPLADAFDPPDGVDVPGQAVANIDGATVREALADLPPDQQRVIELAYFGGLSHTEIATQLAAPIGTVKGRIRLALNGLRVSLGVTPGSLRSQGSGIDAGPALA